MVKFLQISTVILILVFSMHWLVGKNTGADRNDKLSITPPCNEPLTFRAGDIDDRFFITRDELIDVINDVTEVWSDVAGVPAAVYAEDGEVSVNLVYDEQQQLTDREREFSSRIRQRETYVNELDRNYKKRLEQYNERVSAYQNESHRLQRRINELNEWVNERNREGGFNETQLEEFEKRRDKIDRESINLNNEAANLSRMADEINEQLSRLNREINRKNELIREYNSRFSGSRRFTQGTFEWRGNRKWINIYQFANRSELELVVAHEMGHALGLDHVDNPKSVMYHLMGRQESDRLILSHEDQLALRERCGL